MPTFKKIFFLCVLSVFGTYIHAQNTIPTTTCTGALKVNDSLSVSKNITATGDITTSGEVVSKDTMRAQKDIIVDGNAKIAGDISVAGNANFAQDVTINKSILLGGGNEFSFTAATSTSAPTFFLGNSAAKILPWVECPNPSTGTLPQFLNNGKFISRVPAGSGTGLTNSAFSFFSAPWDGSGIIEVDGVDNTGGGNNGLLINYFCGRNTLINVNNGLTNGGGIVFMGTKVSMASSVKIGYDATSNVDPNTALTIFNDQRDGLKFTTPWNNARLISINNSNFSSSPFTLFANGTIGFTTNSGYNNLNIITITNPSISSTKAVFEVLGDGRTHIGKERLTSRPSSSLTVSGEIDCKSLFVLKPVTWSDYVFDSDYKLNDLKAEEEYILKYKHLKGIPSEKEILENGYDLNEMNAKLLAKLEESYLHIIKLQKEVEELKKKVN